MTAVELSNYIDSHLFWEGQEMHYFPDLVKNIRALKEID